MKYTDNPRKILGRVDVIYSDEGMIYGEQKLKI